MQIPFNEPFTSANISSLFGSVKLIPNYLHRLSQIIESGARLPETYVQVFGYWFQKGLSHLSVLVRQPMDKHRQNSHDTPLVRPRAGCLTH